MNAPERKSKPAVGSYRKYVDSRTLSADDFLPGQEFTVTVDRVTIEEVADLKSNDKEATTNMVTLHFVGRAKMMPLNKTNLRMMTGIAKTNEMEKWAGKELIVYRSEQVHFGIPGCLRLRRVGSQRHKTQAPAPVKAQEATQP
jgi:hypothetical protein